MVKKKKPIYLTRYLTRPFLGDVVYISYGRRMAKYLYRQGYNPTWEKVDNYTMNKLMLMLRGDVVMDKIKVANIAARPVMARILGIKLEGKICKDI
jgi:hypothetical protein